MFVFCLRKAQTWWGLLFWKCPVQILKRTSVRRNGTKPLSFLHQVPVKEGLTFCCWEKGSCSGWPIFSRWESSLPAACAAAKEVVSEWAGMLLCPWGTERTSVPLSGNSNATNSALVQMCRIDTHRVKTNRREDVFNKLFMITVYVYVETQYPVALKNVCSIYLPI